MKRSTKLHILGCASPRRLQFCRPRGSRAHPTSSSSFWTMSAMATWDLTAAASCAERPRRALDKARLANRCGVFGRDGCSCHRRLFRNRPVAESRRCDGRAARDHRGRCARANWNGMGARSWDPDDPGVPVSAPRRVTRGGSFLCNEDYCMSYRPSARRGTDPYTSMSHLGFRLVMDADTWAQRHAAVPTASDAPSAGARRSADAGGASQGKREQP